MALRWSTSSASKSANTTGWIVSTMTARSLKSTASNQQHVRRSEEHTSELQSRFDLVCRLLLEKKKDPSPPCPPEGPQRHMLLGTHRVAAAVPRLCQASLPGLRRAPSRPLCI